MNDFETDTFSIFHKTHFVERKLFQTSVVWKIAHLEARADSAGDKIISPPFQCCDILLQLVMYPYDDSSYRREESETYVSLCLRHIRCERSEVNGYCKFKTFDKTGNLREKTAIYSIDGAGRQNRKRIMKTLDLRTQHPTQQVIIFCDVIVDGEIDSKNPLTEAFIRSTVDTSGVIEHNEVASLSKDFEDLYNNPQTADVTLKIDEHEFPAHKLVLRSRSKVFQAMFEHDLQETQQNSICIDEMEVSTLKDVLRFIYCGKVRELPLEEALNLYMAADRYELIGLMTVCRELIVIGMSVSNVCGIAQMADLHNDVPLQKSVKYFLVRNVKKMIETEEWKVFSTNKPVFSLKMLEWSLSE